MNDAQGPWPPRRADTARGSCLVAHVPPAQGCEAPVGDEMATGPLFASLGPALSVPAQHRPYWGGGSRMQEVGIVTTHRTCANAAVSYLSPCTLPKCCTSQAVKAELAAAQKEAAAMAERLRAGQVQCDQATSKLAIEQRKNAELMQQVPCPCVVFRHHPHTPGLCLVVAIETVCITAVVCVTAAACITAVVCVTAAACITAVVCVTAAACITVRTLALAPCCCTAQHVQLTHKP